MYMPRSHLHCYAQEALEDSSLNWKCVFKALSTNYDKVQIRVSVELQMICIEDDLYDLSWDMFQCSSCLCYAFVYERLAIYIHPAMGEAVWGTRIKRMRWWRVEKLFYVINFSLCSLSAAYFMFLFFAFSV